MEKLVLVLVHEHRNNHHLITLIYLIVQYFATLINDGIIIQFTSKLNNYILPKYFRIMWNIKAP